MDTEVLSLVLSILLVTFTFVFGFLLTKVNAIWYCDIKLGAKQKHLLPPGDMGWPILGNMWSFIRAFKSQNPDIFIHNLANRKVLLDDEHFKPGYPTTTVRLTGRKSLHNVSKSEHRRLRRLSTAPINGPDQLSLYIGYIEDIVIHELDKLASLNRPVELEPWMKRLTFKIIMHIFLSSGVEESIIGSTEKYFADVANGLHTIAAIDFPGFAFHKALKARKLLVETFQSILDGKRGNSCKSDDLKEKQGLMDMLLDVQDEDGERLEDEDIIDLLIVFLLAGHETSANIAMWATIYLDDNPEILHKAREEQLEILKARPSTQKGITFGEIKQMRYLQKVIDETLRLVNLAFVTFREAKAEVNINGYVIPKGWKVLVYNRGVHMDSEIYSNPQDFNPSRWDNQNPEVCTFIPFGAGSRICPGAALSKLELSIFLHYFVLNYKLEQVNPNGPVVYLPVKKPTNNCLAKIIKLP